ncbi:hypothetical protein N5P37_005642 [Trichoderma harzianum]|nr:hypothetical protein N5P37_005642 [Trichoderma harzianum]
MILKSPVQRNQRGLYKEQYKGNITLLDLGGEVNVVRKKGSSEYFTARRLNKDKINNLELRHENLITAIELFTEGNIVYAVAENMFLSLSQIVKSPPFPTADEIGIIMGQVRLLSHSHSDDILDGLVYLRDEGFFHGALSCLDVLINESGSVKLTTHKAFTRISPDAVDEDKKGFADICMMLMQKYTLGNGKVGVQNTERWKNSPHIIPFLSSTTSCHRVTELREHPFVSSLWSPESGWPRNILRGLVLTAQFTVRRDFRHSEECGFKDN